MPLPTSLTSISLDEAFKSFLTLGAQVKSEAQTIRNLANAATLDATRLIQFEDFLAGKADLYATFAAVPNLGAYAQTQVSDPSLDIIAAYNTMLTSLTATRVWIRDNFPKAASGELLERKFDANGRTTVVVFTAPQMVPFLVVLNTLLSTFA